MATRHLLLFSHVTFWFFSYSTRVEVGAPVGEAEKYIYRTVHLAARQLGGRLQTFIGQPFYMKQTQNTNSHTATLTTECQNQTRERGTNFIMFFLINSLKKKDFQK